MTIRNTIEIWKATDRRISFNCFLEVNESAKEAIHCASVYEFRNKIWQSVWHIAKRDTRDATIDGIWNALEEII